MQPSLLSEDLLHNLMAAGQTDVLVGLPTQNHAASVAPVVRAVLDAFAGPFMRERTVLLNLDAGSTDGTPELVRRAAHSPDELVAAQYGLRSVHRISAPYHGVPERSTALKMLFTAADLLGARAVVVLDPALAASAEDVARWIAAVLRDGTDYAKPCYPRRWDEGPLVTQLIRPLFSAAYGHYLLEPIDVQLACSGKFAVEALGRDFWSAPHADVGIDAFLSAHAMSGRYRLAQLATASHLRRAAGVRLSVSAVFEQVVAASLVCLARSVADWALVDGVQPVPLEGALEAAEHPPSARFDVLEFSRAFRLGVDALAPLLSASLGQPLFESLSGASAHDPLLIADELWADIAFAFVAAAERGDAPATRLAQMLEPLYLGRVASYLGHPQNALVGGPPLAPSSLVRAFQARKAAFVAARSRLQEVH